MLEVISSLHLIVFATPGIVYDFSVVCICDFIVQLIVTVHRLVFDSATSV